MKLGSSLPFPRVTAFVQKDEGYQQTERVHVERAWKLEGDENPAFLCLRRHFGEKLTAFNADGTVRWEHDPGSCADTQNIQVCPESNTVFAFGYNSISPLDLETGQWRGFDSMPNCSRFVFHNPDGHLLTLSNGELIVRDGRARRLSTGKVPFSPARCDYDPKSRLVTVQLDDRHYVATETGKTILDEPRRTVHPGLSDPQGRLFQVVAQGDQWEVLRIDPKRHEVTRFPVEPGVLAAYPRADGSFITLSLGKEIPSLELRDPKGVVQSRADLPPEGLASISATHDGVLLTFSPEDQNTRVLAFDGQLNTVYEGQSLALTAALPDGSLVVATRDGVTHYGPAGEKSFPDAWTASEALGPLGSYQIGLPLIHFRGREAGWPSFLEDAERVLGQKPPDDLTVRLSNRALEITRPATAREVQERLHLGDGAWGSWTRALSAEGELQRERMQLEQMVFHGGDRGGLKPETWRTAHIFAGYGDEPSAVSTGRQGRDELLGLGTLSGRVRLVNLSPQGPQIEDALPNAIVRTELNRDGLLAMDQRGNLIFIEPQQWESASITEDGNHGPRATGAAPSGLQITQQAIMVGGVRVKRR